MNRNQTHILVVGLLLACSGVTYAMDRELALCSSPVVKGKHAKQLADLRQVYALSPKSGWRPVTSGVTVGASPKLSKKTKSVRNESLRKECSDTKKLMQDETERASFGKVQKLSPDSKRWKTLGIAFGRSPEKKSARPNLNNACLINPENSTIQNAKDGKFSFGDSPVMPRVKTSGERSNPLRQKIEKGNVGNKGNC